MSESIGDIFLGLQTNTAPFKNQIKGISSFARNSISNSFNSIGNVAKKVGGLIATAFAVNSIKSFVSECLELGSNLSEVQNVVDVTFTQMSDSVNKFAVNAMQNYGLSETVAKKYIGTYGAMSKAFGFTEKQAYSMAEAVTALTADVASFYNLSTDEAYTKMKSIWTGETESLKDLGVVMTQTALDQYALANGYDKTTSDMSEQEKVALRYKFVLDQLSLASGDFQRTSEGWANQTRVLSLRFDALKATLGQGFINLFTPIVKMINTALEKLTVLAEKFRDFTAELMGINEEESGAEIVQGLDIAEKSTESLGESADKTKKKLKSLMGFDEINRLSATDEDEKEDEKTSSDFDLPGLDSSNLSKNKDEIRNFLNDIRSLLDSLKSKAVELAEIFKKGFKIGIDFVNLPERFSEIKENIFRIGESLKDIFADNEVISSFEDMTSTFIFNLGKITGSVANIGITAVQLIVGGIEKFLEKNSDRIKQHFIAMFDIGSDIFTILGDFSVAVADIFEVFGNNDAQNIFSDILTALSGYVNGAIELASKLGRELINHILQPITDNSAGIKKAFENTLAPISKVTGSISSTVIKAWESINKVYDNMVKPCFQRLTDGVRNTFSRFINAYNEYVAPMLDRIADKIADVYENHVQPLIPKVTEFFGKVAELLTAFYENQIKPVIDMAADYILPTAASIGGVIITTITNTFGIISDIAGGIMTILSGVVDFLAGVFAGDWSRAWDGIKEIFSGIFDNFKSIVNGLFSTIETVTENIKAVFETLKSIILNKMAGAVESIKLIFSGVAEWLNETVVTPISNFFGGLWTGIKTGASVLGDYIQDNVITPLVDAFKGFYNSVTGIMESVINGFIGMINSFISGINNIASKINDFAGTNIGEIGTLSAVSVPRLANGGIVNQPTLAMVGEYAGANTNPEVIAPLDKLESLNSKGNGNLEKILTEILTTLKALQMYVNVSIGDESFENMVLSVIDRNTARNGGF